MTKSHRPPIDESKKKSELAAEIFRSLGAKRDLQKVESKLISNQHTIRILMFRALLAQIIDDKDFRSIVPRLVRFFHRNA